jgi:hypothetical protein
LTVCSQEAVDSLAVRVGPDSGQRHQQGVIGRSSLFDSAQGFLAAAAMYASTLLSGSNVPRSRGSSSTITA